MLKTKLPSFRKCCRNRRPSEAGALSLWNEDEGDLNVFSIVMVVQADETNRDL
jgi:hypothetical protein